MTAGSCCRGKAAARISVQANIREASVKARGAGRSQNPRIIDAKLQGYLA
jgi:hypothetical protein